MTGDEKAEWVRGVTIQAGWLEQKDEQKLDEKNTKKRQKKRLKNEKKSSLN